MNELSRNETTQSRLLTSQTEEIAIPHDATMHLQHVRSLDFERLSYDRKIHPAFNFLFDPDPEKALEKDNQTE